MLNAVPSAPEKVSEQVSQFWYAERHLPAWSFLRVRAGWPAPLRPASPE
jgi:hypothetical protein